MARDDASLFDVVDVPAKVAANARRCAVCNRPRPRGGYPDEVNILLSGSNYGENRYICSEACRLYYTGGWIEAAPWRPDAA